MQIKYIEESKTLKYNEITLIGGRKKRSYEGSEFERWSSKVVLFVEKQTKSPIKERSLEKYSKLSKENSKEFFDIAVGALQAIEE